MQICIVMIVLTRNHRSSGGKERRAITMPIMRHPARKPCPSPAGQGSRKVRFSVPSAVLTWTGTGTKGGLPVAAGSPPVF